MEEAARTFRSQGYNAIIGGGHRHMFNDGPDAKLPMNLVCGGSYEQLLRDSKNMSDACHNHGLKFFIHQTSTMVDAGLLAKHPEWAAIDLLTGLAYNNTYGTANSCLNNEEFMAEYFKRLEKVVVESGADGLLADEIQFFSPTLCGCPSCRKKFHDDTGLSIPEQKETREWLYQFTGKSSYAAWLAWRRGCVTATLKKIRALVNTSNPNGVLINYLCNPPPVAPFYMAGYTIDDFPEHSSIVGYECEPPRMQSLYYSPLIVAEMKYLRAVAEHMQTGTFRLAYSSSPGEHLWDWCLTRSQGAGAWWLVRDEQSPKVTLPLLAWDARHEVLEKTLTCAADVCVLFSLDARDHNSTPTSPQLTWLRGYLSTCGALSAGHVPFKAIVDRDLVRGKLIDKLKTLILFNTSSMSDAAIDAVREFVREGGTLIASSHTSLYDEHGRVRADFRVS